MNILVTGSAGFIGFHLSKALLERGDFVVGLDNFNNYYDINLKKDRNTILAKNKNYKLYELDVSEDNEIAKILKNEKIDIICHLAAQAGARHSLEHPDLYIKSNVIGSNNVFEAARKADVQNIVYASSSSVYGNNETPWSEIQQVDSPINPYGASKRAVEIMAYTYHHLYKLHLTGLRFFTVYGPWGRPDMAYFKWAEKIVAGQPIDIYNNGEMKRDFTYIDDIVAGIIAALGNPKANSIYNLGNSKSEELGKLVSLLEAGLGRKAKKNFMPMQAGDFLENFADITKAKRDLGFEPKTSLEEGIKQFTNWYKEYKNIK